MPKARRKYCRWWEAHETFDSVHYFTDCSGGDAPLENDEHELAHLVWKMGLKYCPFCGDEIDYCEPSEVLAQDEEEHEYRRGVALGLYGYGGD